MGHDLLVKAQYPRAPTSTTKKCTDQLFALIPGESGSYFPNLVASHNSIFSLQGEVLELLVFLLLLSKGKYWTYVVK